MDLKSVMDGSGGRWTEERHSLFLSWIEASFVRQGLGIRPDGRRNLARSSGSNHERYFPDIPTESTGESWSSSAPPAAAAAAAVLSDPVPHVITARRSTRKRAILRYNTSQDQVVPDVGNNEAAGSVAD
ncbi:hypothetical protein AXF42_Ash000004 [Apostasia shenzhenica]|uniref:Uncharacterized protein n=1 Tax=Apostasia shenzhenica TaxID=1088818 RepID=A0A2I0AF49_9ASPA|nr:hypothetical protein AXF42_Ash000004 [Apostasia shenzhenica]